MKQTGQHEYPKTWAARGTANARAGLMASRRRIGTVAVIAIAALLGYHAVAGNNGLTVYQQKMADDKALAAEVKQLQQENDRLKRHVDHLASDPDAIEYEAHLRLRYMRPGQVTVLNDTTHTPSRDAAPAK